MLKLYNNTNIYILAPANVATWWVELLHQLAFKINSVLWFENVFIKYLWEKNGVNPTPKDYDKYSIKRISEIEDLEENILIVPEIYSLELFKFKKIRKVVRWLSVDNYYFSQWVNVFFRNFNYRILLKLFWNQNYLWFNSKLKEIDVHLVQCEYVKQHLLSKGIDKKHIEYLSDYLIADFFENKWGEEEKENIVCYNPKKWFEYAKKLIRYMQNDDVKFIPIQNMSRQEVINLLKKSKIYIDFWYFPWKDRIPREASTLWCLIIISRMWAWWFSKDFPIDEKYKIKNLSNIKNIRDKILFSMENYHNLIKQFEDYNSLIKNDEEKFNNDLKHVFVR